MMFHTSCSFVHMALGVCLLLLSMAHVDAINLGRDTALTAFTSTMPPLGGDERQDFLDAYINGLDLNQLHRVLELATRRIDALTGVNSSDSVIFRVSLASRRRRESRSIRTLLKSVSAFAVRTGIVQAFKVSCSTFLKTVGRILIGEVQQQIYKRGYANYFQSNSTSRLRRSVHVVPTISDVDLQDGSEPCFCEDSTPYVSSEPGSTCFVRHINEDPFPHVSLKNQLWYISELEFKYRNYFWTHHGNQPLFPYNIYVGFSDRLKPFISSDFDRIVDNDKCSLHTLLCFVPLTSRSQAVSPNVFGCGQSITLKVYLGGLFFPITNLNTYIVCKGIANATALVNEEPKPFMKRDSTYDLFVKVRDLLGADASSLRFVEFRPRIRVDFSSY